MKRTTTIVTGVVGALVAASAVAQEAETESSLALEEIVVTARLAEESLQDVPLSVSAFTSKDIESAGLSSIADLAALTPGFSFREGFGRSNDRPVIRGMSNIQGEANASFFIDGIFVSGPISGYGLDNLERVEVIRGPQSALFGRRTFAGAINYVTKRPTDEFTARVKGTAGNYGLVDGSFSVSGPILPGQLRFTLNSRYYDREGMYTNTVTGERDVGGERSKSVDGSMLWTPVDWFDATLRANYAVDDDDHFAIVRLGDPTSGLPGAEIRNCYQPVAGTRRRGYHCGEIKTPDEAGINTAQFDAAGLPHGLQRNLFRSSLQMNAYASGYTFTSTTAWNTSSTYQATDQDYSSLRGFGGAFETATFNDAEDWSQEFRVSSPTDGRFRWVAGVSQFEEQPGRVQETATLNVGLPGQPDRAPTITPQLIDAHTTNRAVFGLVEFKVTDTFAVTAEGRYAEDKIEAGGTSTYQKAAASGFVPGSYSTGCTVRNTPTGAAPNSQALTCTNVFDNDETFSSFLPRFTATWMPGDDLTVYAQYAKGNKPGGFNADANNARATPTDRANLETLDLRAFEEEEADSYELGLKTRWLDGKLQVNAAAYFIDWSNQQLTQSQSVFEEGRANLPAGAPQPQFLTSYTTNLGKSEIRGVELDVLARLTRYWDMHFTYALQDTEIKSYFSSDQADLIFAGPYTPSCVVGTPCYTAYLAAGDTAGNELPRVPKHSGSVASTVTWPVTDAGSLVWRTDYAYESSRWAQVHNLASTGKSHIVNMRLGWETENWTLTAWVDNLTEDDTAVDILRYIDPASPFFNPGVPSGSITVPVQPPLAGTTASTNLRDFAISLPAKRTYGLTFTYELF